MNLTDLYPLLPWLRNKVADFHAYLNKWVVLLDPGEDEE